MITQDRLKELFYYQQGKLIRLVRAGSQGVPGDVAGSLHPNGYTYIRVDNNKYFAHRLIWLYHYGYLPESLDHKYGKEIGDYLWNLRPCTRSQNNHNSKIRKDNRSGVKGVGWNKVRSLWVARVKVNNKSRHLGGFKNKEEAANAVRVARLKYHGEFANNG